MVSQIGTQACYDLLHVIEHQVEKPMNAQEGKALHHALEMIDQLAHVASRVNIFAKDYFQEIHDQIVKLYGEVDTRVMEFEILSIAEEAKELQNSAAAINSLQAHIHCFLEAYCPSLAQRRVLAMALERADKIADGEDIDTDELAYMAAEAVLEEGIDDLQYARYLLRQLSPEAREKLKYYARASQGIKDLLHDIETTANDASASRFQDKIVPFSNNGIGIQV